MRQLIGRFRNLLIRRPDEEHGWNTGSVLLGAAIVLLLGAGVLFWYSAQEQTSVIRKIEINKTSYLTADEILMIAGLEPGLSPTDEALRTAEKRLNDHGAVAGVDITRTADGIVHIAVSERHCEALIRPDSETVLYEVDSRLHIISRDNVRCVDLPVVSGHLRKKERRFVGLRLRRILEGWVRLQREYPEFSRRVSEIRLKPGGGLAVYLTGSHLRIEMNDELLGRAFHRLYAAIAFLEHEKHNSGLLDLRGDDALYMP